MNVAQTILNSAMAFVAVLAPIVTAIVQVIKTNVPMPKNVVPLVAVGIGLIIGIASQFLGMGSYDWPVRIVAGIFAGLSAVGLFETAFNKREGSTK